MFNLFRRKKSHISYEGHLKNPTVSSYFKGRCGDAMAFDLLIENYIVTDIRFHTNRGCSHTKTAGQAVCEHVINKNLINTLKVNPGIIIQQESDLQSGGQHCAILAVMSLYQGVTSFLLQK